MILEVIILYNSIRDGAYSQRTRNDEPPLISCMTV